MLQQTVDVSELENAVYEAAILPVVWPDVLAALAAVAQGRGGVLFSVSDSAASWTASPDMHDAMIEFVSDGWAANNSRMARGIRKGLHLQPRFVTEAEYDETGAIFDDPIYREFFIPHGLGQSAGTIAPLPNGDMLCFNFERALDLGPFDSSNRAVLDSFRPHLMRSSMLTARLGMERVRSSVDTLAQLGYPAAAIGASGRVLVANDLFETTSGLWTTRGGDRLALLDASAAALFGSALQQLDSAGAVRSVPLREAGLPARHVLHLLPVRRAARDIFTQARAIVVVTSVRSEPGDPAVLQVLFDLTYAEAVLARRIAAGESLEAVARSSGRSISTLRNQLSMILSKTGVTRQAELAVLLNSLMTPAM